jgi:Protein of unknown function (DUF2933)
VKRLFNSCCLNWNVIAGLAVVGLGVWVFEPGLMRAVLPLLIVAICPLSMLFMMRGMMVGQGAQQDQQMSRPGATIYPPCRLARVPVSSPGAHRNTGAGPRAPQLSRAPVVGLRAVCNRHGSSSFAQSSMMMAIISSPPAVTTASELRASRR